MLVPLLKTSDLLNHLFRAANVLRQATYWTLLIRAISTKIKNKLAVVHEEHLDQRRHRRIAETLLRLTLCQGKALGQRRRDFDW